jgi:hypothetical protein
MAAYTRCTSPSANRLFLLLILILILLLFLILIFILILIRLSLLPLLPPVRDTPKEKREQED